MTPEKSQLTVEYNPASEHSAPDFAPRGYDIISVLGRGGMGVVYKARQRGLNRIVALKTILAGLMSTKALDRFRFEAEALARLNHPNIVQVYEIGELNNTLFLSMEFVDGGTLVEVTRSNLRELRAIVQAVEVLARAVHAAHEKGIVHRDLKPSNVLRTLEGTLKIADFGLAKQRDDPAWQASLTAAGEIVGTPAYMAPEQVAGRTEDIAPPTDVYSLGVILYELLTGRRPFGGPTILDTMRQILEKAPPPPSRWEPGVSHRLDKICLQCLFKSPNRRYSTALALADDLRRFVLNEASKPRRWWQIWKKT